VTGDWARYDKQWTGLAAHLYGRKFIGIDTEPKYLDLSIKRFAELAKNMERKRMHKSLDNWEE
jgi:DNA modification methylase